MADPPDSTAARPGRAALLLDLMRREKSAHDGLLVAPLVAGDEQLGIICCVTGGGRTFTDAEAELLQAVADQTAVGLKKAELIERLTAEHVVKDMFDALESGTLATAEAKAGEAHWDFSRPHALLRIERAPENADGPPWPELASRAQAQLRRRYPLGLFDAGRESMRAIVPLQTGDAGAVDRLHEACDELARDAGLTIGISEVDRGVAGAARRMREAVDAATVGRSLAAGGGAVAYGQIGVYRYLVHMELDQAPQDCYGRAVEELMKYDRRRNAQLVETLECYLDSRSSVAASGAGAVHPPQHGAPAARAHRAHHRARPAGGRPPVARARAQARAPAAAPEQPDPEHGEGDHVAQEHEQRPPRLPQERQVALAAQLENREVDRGSAAPARGSAGPAGSARRRPSERPP